MNIPFSIKPKRFVYYGLESAPRGAQSTSQAAEATSQDVEQLLRDPQYMRRINTAIDIINAFISRKGKETDPKTQNAIRALKTIKAGLETKRGEIHKISGNKDAQGHARETLRTKITEQRKILIESLLKEAPEGTDYLVGLLQDINLMSKAAPAAPRKQFAGGNPAPAMRGAPERAPNTKNTAIRVMKAWPSHKIADLRYVMKSAVNFLSDHQINLLSAEYASEMFTNFGPLGGFANMAAQGLASQYTPVQKRAAIFRMINSANKRQLIDMVKKVDHTSFDSAVNQSLANPKLLNFISDPQLISAVQGAGRDIVGQTHGVQLGRAMYQVVSEWPDNEFRELTAFLASSVDSIPKKSIELLIDRHGEAALEEEYGKVGGWFMGIFFDIAEFFDSDFTVGKAKEKMKEKLRSISKGELLAYINRTPPNEIKNMVMGTLSQSPGQLSGSVTRLMTYPTPPGSPPMNRQLNRNAPRTALRVTQTLLSHINPPNQP